MAPTLHGRRNVLSTLTLLLVFWLLLLPLLLLLAAFACFWLVHPAAGY